MDSKRIDMVKLPVCDHANHSDLNELTVNDDSDFRNPVSFFL